MDRIRGDAKRRVCSGSDGGEQQATQSPLRPKPVTPAERTQDDWARELAQLERAEQQLQQGRVQQALRILDERQFESLRTNALALRATALCQGSPAQNKQGAALARKLSSQSGAGALVRRLKTCMREH